jgi:putative redox protein
MEMKVTFPGGKRVDASFGPFTVKTDQSKDGGGEGSAPEPFSYFLASIATCAGIYVLGFCQARNIPTEGISLTQHMTWDKAAHKLGKVRIEIHLPESFPEKYREPVRRAADLCTVKKTIFDPPVFEVVTEVDVPQAGAAVAEG